MSAFESDRVWLAWTGMETDLIFNKGVDLPEFAAFVMVDSDDGRVRLRDYYTQLIALGRRHDVGIILDTPTWMANPDRAAAVDYRADDLPRVTGDAVALVREVAGTHDDVATLVSVQIGPRGDGYDAGISADEVSAEYHRPQIEAAKSAGADIVSAYTLGAAGEAIGIALAASRTDIPAIVSYTVETDGRLADGSSLSDAVTQLVETASPAAIMVNCAHPEHIEKGLDGGAWEQHLAGIVANASRQSHAELDEADVLDDGDPLELSRQLANLRAARPKLKILGGCCGTDLRHLAKIAEHA